MDNIAASKDQYSWTVLGAPFAGYTILYNSSGKPYMLYIVLGASESETLKPSVNQWADMDKMAFFFPIYWIICLFYPIKPFPVLADIH